MQTGQRRSCAIGTAGPVDPRLDRGTGSRAAAGCDRPPARRFAGRPGRRRPVPARRRRDGVVQVRWSGDAARRGRRPHHALCAGQLQQQAARLRHALRDLAGVPRLRQARCPGASWCTRWSTGRWSSPTTARKAARPTVQAAKEVMAAAPAKPGARAPPVILTPDPTLDVRFAAAAWGHVLRASCFDRQAFGDFIAERG